MPDWLKAVHLHLVEINPRLCETGRANLSRHGVDSDGAVSELVRVYREHVPRIQPFPTAPALLERLGGRYRLGLLSDGYEAVQLGFRDRPRRLASRSQRGHVAKLDSKRSKKRGALRRRERSPCSRSARG